MCLVDAAIRLTHTNYSIKTNAKTLEYMLALFQTLLKH